MDVELPNGWTPVDAEVAARLEIELRRELPPSHQLHGRIVHAVARRLTDDDGLFRSDDDRSLYLVHLTWAVENKPEWPWTVRYADIDDFRARWPREQLEDFGDG